MLVKHSRLEAKYELPGLSGLEVRVLEDVWFNIQLTSS